MSKKNKRQKYCPYCQAKQRTIDRLESQIRNYEMKKLNLRPRESGTNG